MILSLMFLINLSHAIEGPSARPLAPNQSGLTCAEQEMQRRTIKLMGAEDTPCSAVIVDAKTILTAAHCLPKRISDGKIQQTDANSAGFTSIRRYDPLTGKYVNIPVGTQGISYRHQRFDRDLAVIRLDDPIPGISPIKMAVMPRPEGHDPARFGKIYAAGFANDDVKDLKYYELSPVRFDQYKNFRWAYSPSKDGTLGQRGDSGGPVFRVREGCQVELYGVSTFINRPFHTFTPANIRQLQSSEPAAIPAHSSGPAAR